MSASARRDQYAIAAVVFVVFAGFAFVIPFLPLFVRELGVVEPQAVALWAGVLIGVSPLLAGAMAPLWGRWADRHGPRRMAVLALSAYVAALLATAAVRDVWQLLAARVGVGLFGGLGPLGLAMATAAGPREETGRAVGLIQAAQILSAAVGPFTGGWLADRIGIRATFVVTAGLCLLALLMLLTLYRGPARAPVGAAREPGDDSGGSGAPPRGGGSPRGPGAAPHSRREGLLQIASLPAVLLTLFVVNFIGRSFTPILPLHLARLGVPAERLAGSTGLLISVYALAAALSASLLGRAAAQLPPRRLLAVSLVGGAACVLPMALVQRFESLLLLAALLGLTSGGALTLSYTIGGLLVPAARRGAAFGLFSSAALVGGALSPAAAGLLSRLELRAIYLADGALFALLAAALVVLLPPLPPGGRSEDREV